MAMSDCSTEDMKPKVRFDGHNQSEIYDKTDRGTQNDIILKDWVKMILKLPKEQINTVPTPNFAFHLPREWFIGYTDGIEDCKDLYQELIQRYQQLEQVARDMLHDLENANNLAFNGHTDVALDVIRAAAERYRGMIEDCGVSLDD